jgi:predicted oxidoreductase
MERVEITDGLSLSRIVYGMWRLGDDADRSADRVRAKVEACLAQGITTMDQADIYGDYESETLFGAALRADPSLRDRIEVVTKTGICLISGKHPARRVKHYDTSGAYIAAQIEASRRNMGVDVIDVLLLHRPDPLMDHRETGAALDAAVSAGKVRAVGVSNFRPWDCELLQSAMQTRLSLNQIELSLMRTTPFFDGDVAWHQQRDLPLMAWSPLAGGRLVGSRAPATLNAAMQAIAGRHGVDASAVALAWLLRHPARILPVIGTNNLDRLGAAAEALSVDLDRETWFDLLSRATGQEVP